MKSHSQLLDVLLDVNDSDKIPPHLRFDLRSPPPDEASVPDLTPDRNAPSYEELQQAQAALQEARMEMEAGQISPESYQETELALCVIINQDRTLANLLKTTHSTLEHVPPDIMPEDLKANNPAGFFSPAHEDEYLASLDAYLDEPHPDDQPLPPKSRPNEKERDRDQQLHNPVSVYNWIADHKPSVINDDDASTEKPPKPPRKSSPKQSTSSGGAGGGTAAAVPPPRSTSKREKAGALIPKPEEEILDEDGSVIGGFVEDVTASQKKRKRGQDDDAYRPKGGGGKKRKRASTKNSNTPAGGENASKGDAETAMDET